MDYIIGIYIPPTMVSEIFAIPFVKKYFTRKEEGDDYVLIQLEVDQEIAEADFPDELAQVNERAGCEICIGIQHGSPTEFYPGGKFINYDGKWGFIVTKEKMPQIKFLADKIDELARCVNRQDIRGAAALALEIKGLIKMGLTQPYALDYVLQRRRR